MEWNVEWGPKLDVLLNMRKAGKPVQALDRRPELTGDLAWHYSCFTDLCSDRRVSSEGIPLPLTTGELRTYFIAYGYQTALSFSDFSDNLRMIDRVWLEKTLEKIAAKRAAQKASEASKPQATVPRRVANR